MNKTGFIGVTDSGVGGITTLSALMRWLPGERFVYFADRRYAPYGERGPDEVRKRQLAIAEYFVSRGAKALVVACNTATNVCIETLRGAIGIPVVGTEPAVAPAVRTGGKTAVLVTPLTLKSAKFAALLGCAGPDVTALALPGLAEAVEKYLDEPNKAAALLPWQKLDACDNIVLGCTHYIFLRGCIAERLPRTRIFDGNEGVARRLSVLINDKGLGAGRECGAVAEFVAEEIPNGP